MCLEELFIIFQSMIITVDVNAISGFRVDFIRKVEIINFNLGSRNWAYMVDES
jgi:hypothetical protein